MAQVLVTGANGFIGAHLVRALLAQGDDVACLVRRSAQLDRLHQLPVRLCYGDVTQPETLEPAVRGVKIVYHLAGVTSAPDRFHAVNAIGTGNVVAACAAQDHAPVLVMVSSLSAAGPAPVGRVRFETDRLVQVSAYGRSKRAGELAAQRLAHRVPISVVRPPMVFGPMDEVSLDLFRMVGWYHVFFIPGLARYHYSMIHATDLARLLILAAQRGRRLAPCDNGNGHSSQGYYFAAGEADPSFDELGRMIAAALNEHHVVAIPTATPLIWLAAGGGELVARLQHRPLFLNLDKAAEISAGSWVCSPRAACDELGFRVGASLQQRLCETAAWYHQAGWL